VILAVARRAPPPRRRWSALVVAGIAAGALGWTIAASAGEPDDDLGRKDPRRMSSTEINKRVADPISTTWSIELKTDFTLLDLDAHGTELQTEFVLRPTMPIIIGEHVKLIVRPQFTLVDDTPYTNAAGALRRTTGFGDTVLDLVIGPRATPWLLAFGPTFTFPTASVEQTGQGKWEIGPAGVVGYHAPTWLAALIGQQWFSYAGDADRRSVSELHLQYIANWFFGDGWSAGTRPTMKVNWNAAAGQQVTFPFGPAVAKVIKFGDALPVKFELELYYVPVHPDNGAQAIFEFKVTPVVPSPLP
jgi:hypothetical protein